MIINQMTNEERLCQSPDARLLVVDDEKSNLILLQAILEEAGYRHVRTTADPREVEAIRRDWHPDIVLLDLMMPVMDGFQIMRQLQESTSAGAFLPILILTADVTIETRQRALGEGAHDFLSKPFDHTEVLLRIRNLLSLHFVHGQLHEQNTTLEQRVRERTREVEESQLEVLERLARAAEFRDDDTGQHTHRVGTLCELTAVELGCLPQQADLIRHAAPLHDVGKIAIPDSILLKPGKLTPEEFDIIKTHAVAGAELLSGGRSEMVQMAERIARSHHERWDGNGYPHRLAAEAIPIEGRVTAVADVFDALTHERPYKKAWPREQALEEISKQSGSQFDPKVVDAFLKILPEE